MRRGARRLRQLLESIFPDRYLLAREAQERQTAELARDLPVMRELLDSPGWKRLEQLMEEQMELRTALVMESDGAQDVALKGEVRGIRLVMERPGAIIEEAEQYARRANGGE